MTTSAEAQFEAAIKEPKIRDIKDTKPLDSALKYAIYLLGIRKENMPTNADFTALASYVERYYGGHTVTEIRLAFEMALAGQLSLSEKEVAAYENFSVAYVTKVLNAYRNWAREAHKFVEHREIKSLPPSVPENLKWEEMIESEYQSYLSGLKCLWRLFPSEFYSQLVQDGLLEENDFLLLMEQARVELAREVQKRIVASQGMKGEKYNGITDMEKELGKIREGEGCELRAKQMAVMYLFKYRKSLNKPNLYVNETK